MINPPYNDEIQHCQQLVEDFRARQMMVQNEAKLKRFEDNLKLGRDQIERTVEGLKIAYEAGSELPVAELRAWADALSMLAQNLETMTDIDASITGELSQIVSAMELRTRAVRHQWRDRIDDVIRSLSGLERLRRQYRKEDRELKRWIQDKDRLARSLRAGSITQARITTLTDLEDQVEATQRELVGDSGVMDSFWADVRGGGAHLGWLTPQVRDLLDARGVLGELKVVSGEPAGRPPASEVMDAVIEEFIAFDGAAALRSAVRSAKNARDFIHRAKEQGSGSE